MYKAINARDYSQEKIVALIETLNTTAATDGQKDAAWAELEALDLHTSVKFGRTGAFIDSAVLITYPTEMEAMKIAWIAEINDITNQLGGTRAGSRHRAELEAQKDAKLVEFTAVFPDFTLVENRFYAGQFEVPTPRFRELDRNRFAIEEKLHELTKDLAAARKEVRRLAVQEMENMQRIIADIDERPLDQELYFSDLSADTMPRLQAVAEKHRTLYNIVRVTSREH